MSSFRLGGGKRAEPESGGLRLESRRVTTGSAVDVAYEGVLRREFHCAFKSHGQKMGVLVRWEMTPGGTVSPSGRVEGRRSKSGSVSLGKKASVIMKKKDVLRKNQSGDEIKRLDQFF